MQYRIGEFARLSGISIKTLRFYDRIGLFQPAAVDPRTRYRLYVPQQLQDLAAVLALRDLGASLNDIRRVVRRTAPRQEHSKLLEKLRRNAEGSMEAARRSLVWIDDALGKLTDGEREIAVLVKQRAAIRVASCRAQVKMLRGHWPTRARLTARRCTGARRQTSGRALAPLCRVRVDRGRAVCGDQSTGAPIR